MYRGGSPTDVQAWQPCPLWEPSPRQSLYYSRLGDLLCFVFIVSDFCCVICVMYIPSVL